MPQNLPVCIRDPVPRHFGGSTGSTELVLMPPTSPHPTPRPQFQTQGPGKGSKRTWQKLSHAPTIPGCHIDVLRPLAAHKLKQPSGYWILCQGTRLVLNIPRIRGLQDSLRPPLHPSPELCFSVTAEVRDLDVTRRLRELNLRWVPCLLLTSLAPGSLLDTTDMAQPGIRQKTMCFCLISTSHRKLGSLLLRAVCEQTQLSESVGHILYRVLRGDAWPMVYRHQTIRSECIKGSLTFPSQGGFPLFSMK